MVAACIDDGTSVELQAFDLTVIGTGSRYELGRMQVSTELVMNDDEDEFEDEFGDDDDDDDEFDDDEFDDDDMDEDEFEDDDEFDEDDDDDFDDDDDDDGWGNDFDE